VTDGKRPAQNGHPVPPVIRLFGDARHSWSGPSGHLHQTFRPDPRDTLCGLSAPLRLGCHWATRAGQSLTQYLEPCESGSGGAPSSEQISVVPMSRPERTPPGKAPIAPKS
jgi:hypothetical protein